MIYFVNIKKGIVSRFQDNLLRVTKEGSEAWKSTTRQRSWEQHVNQIKVGAHFTPLPYAKLSGASRNMWRDDVSI